MKSKLFSVIGATTLLLSFITTATSEACVTVNTQQETYVVDGQGSVDY